MRNFKSRSFVFDALFVIVVMAAAMASAFLEAGAVFSGWPSIDPAPAARSATPNAVQPAAAGSSVDGAWVDGAWVSVASMSSAR